MNHDDFDKIFEDQVEFCRQVLLVKGREYTPNHDRFHNFTVAASLMGCTPEQALGGFLAKHLVSVYDLLRKNEYVPMSVWDEKIGDAMNYLFLLKGILVEYELMGESQPEEPPAAGVPTVTTGDGRLVARYIDGVWRHEPGFEDHWTPTFRTI